jgi:hypothetical protein
MIPTIMRSKSNQVDSSKGPFKKVTVKIQGGLGNQLFQFFAGLKIALENDSSLKLDTSAYGLYSNSQPHEFPYILKYGRIGSNFEVTNSFPRIRREVFKELSRLPLQLRNGLGYFKDNELINLAKSMNNLYLDGYYQDVALLPSFPVIDEYLQLDGNRLSCILEEIELVRSIQPILIHVRRGDYLTMPTIYQELTREYYFSGISHLETVLGKREVWLISDEPKGALHLLGNKIVVDKVLTPQSSIDPSQYLEMMSHFKGIVTANSTFSWWGAYLGYGRGNTQAVVMPSSFRHNEAINQHRLLGVNGWHIMNSRGDSV